MQIQNPLRLLSFTRGRVGHHSRTFPLSSHCIATQKLIFTFTFFWRKVAFPVHWLLSPAHRRRFTSKAISSSQIISEVNFAKVLELHFYVDESASAKAKECSSRKWRKEENRFFHLHENFGNFDNTFSVFHFRVRNQIAWEGERVLQWRKRSDAENFCLSIFPTFTLSSIATRSSHHLGTAVALGIKATISAHRRQRRVTNWLINFSLSSSPSSHHERTTRNRLDPAQVSCVW